MKFSPAGRNHQYRTVTTGVTTGYVIRTILLVSEAVRAAFAYARKVASVPCPVASDHASESDTSV